MPRREIEPADAGMVITFSKAMRSETVIFTREWAGFRLWLRPQTTTEWVSRQDWSTFISRMPLEYQGKSYYLVRIWLRRKEPHQSRFGSVSDPVVEDGHSYSLIRLWTKVPHKKAKFVRVFKNHDPRKPI